MCLVVIECVLSVCNMCSWFVVCATLRCLSPLFLTLSNSSFNSIFCPSKTGAVRNDLSLCKMVDGAAFTDQDDGTNRAHGKFEG